MQTVAVDRLPARTGLAIVVGIAAAILTPVLVSLVLAVEPGFIEEALADVGLGPEGLEGVALFSLSVAAGLQVGVVAGWFLPDARRLRRHYASLLAATLTLSVLLLVGVFYIGDFTNADGPGDAWSYIGLACLPLALIGYWFLARRTARKISEASAPHR